MAAMGTMGVFWVAFLRSLDIAPHVAAIAFATQAFTQVITALLIAPWIDRIQPRYVAMAGFASVLGAMLIAANASVAWHGFAGAILGGIGLGAGMLIQTHIWPSYYGREHIGAVRGAAMPLTLVDVAGFATGWLAAAGGLAVGLALLFVSPKPLFPQQPNRAV